MVNEWRFSQSVRIKGLDTDAVVFFFRGYEEDWGYMGMRDYRTYEPTNEYHISVVHYRKGCDRVLSTDAGYDRNSFTSKSFDKDMANKIWYNLSKLHKNYSALYNFVKSNNLMGKEA